MKRNRRRLDPMVPMHLVIVLLILAGLLAGATIAGAALVGLLR